MDELNFLKKFNQWPLAECWEALVTYQQLVILCDEDGVVDMAYNAISRHTPLPAKVVEKGIAYLLSPHADAWPDFCRDGYVTKTVRGYEIVGYARLVNKGRLSPYQWAAVRATVFARDGYTCAYCGRRGGQLECDHIKPISRGGSNELNNLVTACKTCNQAKGAKRLNDWLEEKCCYG